MRYKAYYSGTTWGWGVRNLKRKSKKFLELVDEYGYSEVLEKNSFKSSGTGVNTKLVALHKND